ncbi:tripartite tricarboxylate transporter permease [Rubripirellula reticaptiva]|uniref:Tripartite tricarboxylate transporter TctA family protein n=1 Tax=Rubripirellula reticaptiva TaxID=2528013 RepID=A0A5C6EPA8_9BACT|nr:tripartite tricarboxylate transporter permease [Rubripirellula reticaptiva]TWU49847.1 Tripartite tricarboxylate transporter TctA family protein [Rubripirellula reticaptiva]
MFTDLGTAAELLFSPTSLMLVAIGSFLGIIVGAIPGLTGAMLIALALPLTFSMGGELALVLLVSMYVGSVSGGLVTATLLRMPGTPASIMTTLDGYPMAQQGKSGRALALGIGASFVGGMISWGFLVCLAEPMAIWSLSFGPFEFTALVLVAMVLIMSVSGRSLSLGVLAGAIGVLIAMPGSSPATGVSRWTLGLHELDDGFKLLPVLIGLFAVNQVIRQLLCSGNEGGVDSKLSLNRRILHSPSGRVEPKRGEGRVLESSPRLGSTLLEKEGEVKLHDLNDEGGNVSHASAESTSVIDSGDALLFHRRDLRTHGPNLLRSSLIGTWIGILPGIGANIGSVIAYAAAKKSSKHPEQFGHGSEEGVVASESANNATIGGALIPLVSMGIPGSVIDAILLGAFVIHGLQPGPMLMQQNPLAVQTIMGALLLANVFTLLFLLVGARSMVRVASIPRYVLLPVVMIFCVIGSFALANRMFDVWVMLGFGVAGYLLERARIPLAPLVIGFVLAPIGEEHLSAGLMQSGGSWLPLIQRPISMTLCVVAAAIFSWTLWQRFHRNDSTHSNAP